jgi:hypothetical protein
MKCMTFHFGLLGLAAALFSGCCVSHSLSIKNNTGGFVTVAAKDTGRGVSISADKRGELPFWQGPLLITVDSNVWFYHRIGYREDPEATKHVFRFGVCRAGFGYIVTHATLEPGGRLTVGSGFYEPEIKTQW